MKISLDQNPGVTGSLTKPAPLINNLLWVFLLAMVLANVSGFMYLSLLPLYLQDLNASVVEVGLFFTLSQIVALALQILGGWISDSLGRLRSIALGSIAGVLSYVGLILAPTWHWVLLGEGFGAITRSLVAPSFNAFIAEQSSEENRARVFGITETVFNLVSVVGPPLGGLLANLYGFKFMLFCAAVLYTLATILRIGMAQFAARNKESQPAKLTFGGLKLSLGSMLGMVLAGGLITWVLITDGVRDVAYALSFNLLPLYLKDLGGLNIQQISLLESVFGVFLMITSVPAGILADKYGERLGIASGFVMHFFAMMVFIRVSGFWGFACAWALLGMGVGLLSPAYNALISKAVPEKLRGTAFGLFSTSLGVISLPAPVIGAQLWSRREPRFPFMLTGWLSLLAILPVWLKFKSPANGEKSEGKS